MPRLADLLVLWRPDPVALTVAMLLAVAYGVGVRRLARRGHAWPRRPLWWFAGGLAAYLLVTCGPLGVLSNELRWTFAARVALLLFVVPPLVTLAQPAALLRISGPAWLGRRIARAERSKVARILGSAAVSPLVAALFFALFLTPVMGVIRGAPVGETAVTVFVPLLGFVLIAPVINRGIVRTSTALAGEFLVAFVELVLDALPGILLRLDGNVVDPGTAVSTWVSSPLRDQQLAGDLLWFLAEVADVPILVLLFLRWSRRDTRDARTVDELTDDEVAALTAEHLRRRG